MSNRSLIIFSFLSVFISCKYDKPHLADLYIDFQYDGTKIDTTTTEKDQVIFTNFDGSPVINVPNNFPDECDNKTFIGTFALGDTIKWHLRLVSPDGSPQLFQVYMNSKGEPIPIQNSLHFLQPTLWNFEVRREFCDDQMIIVIGN